MKGGKNVISTQRDTEPPVRYVTQSRPLGSLKRGRKSKKNMNNLKALQYLKARYNPALGLCHEAPIDNNYKSTYWTMNDNGLAIRAFDRLGDAVTRDAINKTLQGIKAFDHDGFKNNGWTDVFIHKPDMRLNQTPEQTHYQGTQCYRIVDKKVDSVYIPCTGGLTGIWHEEANGGIMYDDDNYFLLLAAKALSFHKAKIYDIRDQKISLLEKFWDWDNYGFNNYMGSGPLKATMNLGVYILLGEKTGWSQAFTSKIRPLACDLMNKLQVTNGGFASQYFTQPLGLIDWGRTDTFSNTETTSICIYANIRPRDY